MGLCIGMHRVSPQIHPLPLSLVIPCSWTSRYNYENGTISSSVVEQAEQTMRNINSALVEAGASTKDIVRVRYILPDRSDFPKTWPVLQKWLGDVRPAATMIQAGLMEEAMKIEIEVTARKTPDNRAGEKLMEFVC